MMKSMQSRALGLSAVIVWFCVSAMACKSPSREGAPGVQGEQPAATYTVQGVVKMLPPAAQPGNDKTIVVLHQAVPRFKDQEGKEVGMMAMPMPFTLAPNLDMAGIEVGSKVEFTFGIFWKAPTPTRILSIKKLPDETQIHFNVDE